MTCGRIHSEKKDKADTLYPTLGEGGGRGAVPCNGSSLSLPYTPLPSDTLSPLKGLGGIDTSVRFYSIKACTRETKRRLADTRKRAHVGARPAARPQSLSPQ